MDRYISQIAALLDALGCGAMLVHESGEIVHVNQRMCDYSQRPRGDLLGRRVTELYETPAERALIESLLQAAPTGRGREIFVPRPDGTRLPVMFTGRQCPGQPPLSHYQILTLIDISEHKQTEERLHEQYEEVSKLSDTVVAEALDLKSYSQTLEARVREKTADLHEANRQAIHMLAVACEARDDDTGEHVRRIQLYAQRVAEQMGLSATEAEHIGVSSILHDVGKIHVPDSILKKPGPLTHEERLQMQQHTLTGERIISDEPFFDTARAVARSHHEDFNGGGYPDGLAGLDIPLPARIVHLADVFDALTSRRVYKPAFSPEKSLNCVLENRAKQFDPDIVDAFVALYRRRSFEDLLRRAHSAVARFRSS